MKKNSLTPNKGLSLSQAQSISNLCFQKASEIDMQLNSINNSSKKIKVDGEELTLVNGTPMPDNIIELLELKAKLHACQAFLMENIKAKDAMLNETMTTSADISDIEEPKKPDLINSHAKFLPKVNERWGWEQLCVSDINEYLESEAYAAHIGQFIHKDGVLHNLRNELKNIKPVEWMEIKSGEKTPVKVEIHHTQDKLFDIHEKLSALHRKHEQRVNYFKSIVKNLVTNENARIAKHNTEIQIETEALNQKMNSEYKIAMDEYTEKIKTIQNEFEIERQKRIKEIVSMRISVDERFQKIIDMFLSEIKDDRNE